MLPLLLASVVTFGPMRGDIPAREPQMASSGTTVALAFGAGKAIYVSVSRDGGKSFASPVQVAQSEILPLNRHRGPRVAISHGVIVVAAVGGTKEAAGAHSHGLPSDGDLWAWRSSDNGKTWSKATRINDVAGAPTEGLHALADDGKGNLLAAWLDKRGQGTQLYASRSADDGQTWSKNVMIYESPEGTICQCCHPSIAFAPDGQMLVMFRNWLNGSRDMYLARSLDGVHFSKPEKLGLGTWKLNACPMDGGGIAVTRDRIVTAWRRESEIFLASPGEKEVDLGKGIDVSVAAAPNGVYAVWTAPDGLKAVTPGGKMPLLLAPEGTFPNVVGRPDGSALVAWESDGKIETRKLP